MITLPPGARITAGNLQPGDRFFTIHTHREGVAIGREGSDDGVMVTMDGKEGENSVEKVLHSDIVVWLVQDDASVRRYFPRRIADIK